MKYIFLLCVIFITGCERPDQVSTEVNSQPEIQSASVKEPKVEPVVEQKQEPKVEPVVEQKQEPVVEQPKKKKHKKYEGRVVPTK